MTMSSQHKLPFIAIVGKPNVGKSSLFNRVVGQKIAITSELPGTTRDRVFRKIDINGLQSILVDTGGLEFNKKENIEADMQSQSHIAINEADLVLFMVDGRALPTKDDLDAAQILRRKSKKVIFIANKIDHPQNHESLNTWTELGFGMPHWISVIHNKNVDGLIHQIETHLRSFGWDEENTATTTNNTVKIALIGRPNAGKSSIVNSLLGQERVIVSDVPGTTRDSIDIELSKDNQHYTLIDTAGLRRRGKIEQGIEKFSSFRTIDSIERSDIVCLVLDYSVGIRAQDLHISSYILEAHKGLIILINKSDLMEDKEAERDRIGRILKSRFDFLSWAPVLFVSAKNGRNLDLVLETSQHIVFERRRKIDHEQLVDFIREKFHKHQPPLVGHNKVNFYDMVQFDAATPTFQFTVNKAENVHFSYRRYLENEFRADFGFDGTAINFLFKTLDPKLLKKAKPI